MAWSTLDLDEYGLYQSIITHARRLGFASRKLSAIEIDATFYRTQTPGSFHRWADETPDDFVFSIKAHWLTTHHKLLAENGPAIDHFLSSGLLSQSCFSIPWDRKMLERLARQDGVRPVRSVRGRDRTVCPRRAALYRWTLSRDGRRLAAT
ncbi:MAG: DUF72 domain-containing protein [Methylocella sp.]